jgi:L,D-peptidoglycan transpeptidase YkuD (ErfK/YbiS/YcfS/YnhG family)
MQLQIENNFYKCSIGAAGIKKHKQEGDQATPAGEFALGNIYFRPDRISIHELDTDLPLIAIDDRSGWCDDVNSPSYNQYVRLPFAGRHEKLWRDDSVYDIVIVIEYNTKPVEQKKGSAIFMHLARETYSPTEGCVALAKKDMLEIIPYLCPGTSILIEEQGIKLLNTRPAQIYSSK